MARRVRRQQSSDRTDLRSIVREELARMGMSPGKINQGQTILPSATYDAKQLGGSKASDQDYEGVTSKRQPCCITGQQLRTSRHLDYGGNVSGIGSSRC